MKTFVNAFIIGVLLLGLNAFIVPTTVEEWVVPEKYQKMSNPTDADDDDNIEIGEELFMQHCKSCHGKEGLGDGPKAKDQEGELGDFSSDDFQAQSDGSLFYKTTFGRDDMPNYEKKMPDDEDRWLVVNYMRLLGE